jgi:gliding motility-associated-like protein
VKSSFILFFILLALPDSLLAQLCTAPGQTPSSAVLVCGNTSVTGSGGQLCGQINIPVSCNTGTQYKNINPHWYKIACHSSGTLGFIITPDDLNENYDWQLFDITNDNPDDVFSDPAMFVCCNWSPEVGETGASIDGTKSIVCDAGGEPLFSKMPDLIIGHEYLLMVSHKINTANGFQLTFTGGTADITDPIYPEILSARLSCDGTSVIVKINRGIQCSSIAPDGSDFIISGGYNVISAGPSSCGGTGSIDSVTLILDSPLPSGNYILTIQNGNDGSTLEDRCTRPITPGQQATFTVAPLLPTPMDSIRVVGCSPATLQLVFSRPIQCFSIEPGGSDFIVTGPQPVVITGIATSCNNPGPNPPSRSSVITLQLSAPIATAGTYQVKLVTGADGNTIIDECGRESTAGATLSFTVKDPVTSNFTTNIKAFCTNDSVIAISDETTGVTWSWYFDNALYSNAQMVTRLFPAGTTHTIRLIVSNGSCIDTSAVTTLKFPDPIIVSFSAPIAICPNDTVRFVNTTTNIDMNLWQWDFGDGTYSSLTHPPIHQYPAANADMIYTVRVIGSGTVLDCRDTVTSSIRVLRSCYIAVPSAFTPNGDGLNDYLYPLNALKADDLHFKIFNRFGQVVFESRDWTKKWDGRIRGAEQPTGVYAWLLSFTHHDTGKKVFLKGTTVLLR